MKKVFLIAAAVVALAACSKNEVLPSSSINNEISFNVAPRTKADPEEKTFNTNNVFASWAYYLPKDSYWGDPAAGVTPQEYIVGRTISYQTDGTWKEKGKTYYWPKDGGSLTFFAYSLNRDNLKLAGDYSEFTCEAATGIQGHIDLADNKNTDFMVAEIAKNKTANEPAHSFNGVPTLFKHKLSKVACTVKKEADYQNVKFYLKKIEFLSVSHYATYAQIPKDTVAASGTKVAQVYTSENQEITSTLSPVAKEDVVIYIPQKFTEETDLKKISKIKVTYTITTTVEGTHGSTTEVEQTVEREYPIKDKFAEWEMGKKYIFNLTFKLDEILWAPAVEPWVDAPAGEITVM